MATPLDDPVLKRFRAAIGDLYGARLARAVLLGSRAGSDYDVAVFLEGAPRDRLAEAYRLADFSTAILEETGECVHAAPYHADLYGDPRLPLMHEICREDVDL